MNCRLGRCQVSKGQAAVGPVLQDGLSIKPHLAFDLQRNQIAPSGAEVYYNGALVLSVNETGRRLLCMADGAVTLGQMAEAVDLEMTAGEVGLFFVHLAQAGYLKNRIDMTLYEAPAEACP